MPPLRVQGHFVADHVQRIEIDATLVPSGDQWSVTGNLEGLDFSPEFVRALPAVLSRRLAELGSLRCSVQGRFRLAHQAAKDGLDFDVNGRLSRGRIDDPRLPYPLTDLRANFHARQPGDGRHRGYRPQRANDAGRSTFTAKVIQSKAPTRWWPKAGGWCSTQQLRSILPFDWQGEWHKFLPAGEFDADLKLELRRPELAARTDHRLQERLVFLSQISLSPGTRAGRVELVDNLLRSI